MHDFLLATLGGLTIALSSTLHFYLKGRVTGFSGIVFSLWSGKEGNNIWRWGIVLGLLLSSAFARIITLNSSNDTLFFESQKDYAKNFNIIVLILAGIFVGFGTKLGNGCTSGHGVCGLPRLSGRSIVAVLVFFMTAVIIATIRYHYPFLSDESQFLINMGKDIYEKNSDIYTLYYYLYLSLVSIIIVIFIVVNYIRHYNENNRLFSDSVVGLITGITFGFGLCLAGMSKRSKVINFLALSKDWDASLMFVLGSAVGVNFITFNYILRKESNPPFSDSAISVKSGWNIDFNLVFGAFVFGIGWGLSGLCPGPVMVDLFLYFPVLIIFISCIIVGQYIAYVYVNLNKNNTDSQEKNQLVESK